MIAPRPRLLPFAFAACAALLPAAAPCQAGPEAAPPPVAKKQPHPVQIHGDTLADDYYWLRNKGTPRSRVTTSRRSWPTPRPS